MERVAAGMRDTTEDVEIATREHLLPPSAKRDVPLRLREIALDDDSGHEVPIVLVHGATFGSVMFDIPVPGYSLQRFLAVRGWQSFALDVRGYGRSGPSTVLDAPPGENEPYARLSDAVDDLASAVQFVFARTGSEIAHVVSFSWGTVIASVFAARYPELVGRLVLYAPLYGETNKLWIDRIGDPGGYGRVNPRLGSYRWINKSDVRFRWNADLPAEAQSDSYREERVLCALFDALSRADPRAAEQNEPAFRAPAGALVDLFEVFSGRPLYDPTRILAPTLLIRGQDDTTSTESDTLRLLGALGSRHKRYVAIAPGSHFLCAERNAAELFGEIDLFLSY